MSMRKQSAGRKGLYRSNASREGIGFSVYRPSIVYGNSRTGRSIRFSAVYYPIRTILFLRDLYDADIRERGGSKAREMNVMLSGDGSLHLPIKVEVSENGGVNLIPIDYFVDAFMALMSGIPIYQPPNGTLMSPRRPGRRR
ncbi:MAG: hypothetical protein ABSC57_09500 [Syntrophales bacterium]